MNHIDILKSIQINLDNIASQVRLSSAANEYDINTHVEKLFIPLLNLILDADLKNSNYQPGDNPAIDLYDEVNQFAIQVTSIPSTEKIIKTLETTVAHSPRIKEFFFLMLRPKKQVYKEEAIKKIEAIIGGRFTFNVYRNILDLGDIYVRVEQINDLRLSKQIADLLRSNFTELKLFDSLSVSDYKRFKKNYYSSCLTLFSRINFFGLSVSLRPREIELERLFVEPRFTVNNYIKKSKPDEDDLHLVDYLDTVVVRSDDYLFKKYAFASDDTSAADQFISKGRMVYSYFEYSVSEEEEEVSLQSQLNKLTYRFGNLFNGNNNIVILGNPGSGKSCLIKYSICKIVTRELAAFSNNYIYGFIPFRVELYKYNQAKQKHSLSVINFLKNSLQADFQATITEENLTHILTHFNCLVFFDGLDEVFDVQERIDVRNDIETFTNSFEKARVIVTSRYESYEEVKLDSRLFSVYEVNSFSPQEIESYVSKWYSVEASETRLRTNEINECLQQLKLVEEEIKCNPLLLSLVLILYRNNGGIPTSKMAIYEGCTNTIVESRDSNEKNLDINLMIKNKASIFSALAYWQFTNEIKGKQNISYSSVVSFIKNYLISKLNFDDDQIAEQATTQFLNFSKVRSIYFQNRFTHKTFFEYFTAYYLFSNFYVKSGGRDIFFQTVDDNIGNSSWAVILELLICKVDSTQIDNEVIDSILLRQIHTERTSSIVYCLNIAKYLSNVSYNVLNNLITIAVKHCIAAVLNNDISDTTLSFFNSLVDIRKSYILSQLLEKFLIEEFKRSDENTQIIIKLFAHEYCICCDQYHIIDKLNQFESGDIPHLFILGHYKKIMAFENYFELLNEFRSRYTDKACMKIYPSIFKQKIFYSGESFNWITFYYLFNRGIKPITRYRNIIKVFPSGQAERTADLNLPDKPMCDVDLEYEYRAYIYEGSYQRFARSLSKHYLFNNTQEHVQKASPDSSIDLDFL